jgi:hypothetical protein
MNNEMEWALKMLTHINLSPVPLKIEACDEISPHWFGYVMKSAHIGLAI